MFPVELAELKGNIVLESFELTQCLVLINVSGGNVVVSKTAWWMIGRYVIRSASRKSAMSGKWMNSEST